MKKIIFDISEVLLSRADEAAVKDGFNSRSEFLRFLIVTYLKKEHPNLAKAEADACEADKEETDEFANVDLEFGIPEEVIEKLKKKAAILTENERRQQS